MRDLQERLAKLRQNIQNGSEDASALEREARSLLSEAKNTVYEAEVQALFAQLAQQSRNTDNSNPQLRGLLRRARIRIEMAGDDDDIDEAMIGNICRCGTYQRIKKAIHRTVELKKQDS